MSSQSTKFRSASSRRFNVLQKFSFAVLVAGALIPAPSAFSVNDAFNTAPTASGGVANFTGNFTLNTTTPAAAGTGTPATGDALYFGTSTTTTLNDDLAAGISFAGLTFNTGASAFTIGGNAFVLTGNVVNNSTSLQTINNAVSATAVRTFTMTTGGGNITLGGAFSGTAGGITTAGAGTLTLGAAGNSYTGATTVATGTTLSLTGTLTGGTAITVNGTGALSETGAGAISGASTLTINGTGTSTLAGANTYTGATSVNGGTLTLDFSAAAAPTTATNIINSANTVNLGGGTLALRGGGAGATNSQTFATTALTANTSSSVTLNSNSGTALNLVLGGITRNAQSTVDIAFPAAGTVSTTSTTFVSNGVLVSAATNGIAFGTSGGTTWLTNASGTLGALSTYATGTANYTATNNVDVTSGDSVSGVTVNTLRFNAANDALTLAGTNVVSTGGILVTGTGTGSSIAGGTLTSGGGRELVIIDNGSLSVSSVIANNTGGASTLTLAGTGTTTLTAANTYTGNTSINAGTTRLGVGQVGTTSGALGTGGGTTSVAAGATLDLSTFNVTTAAALGTGTITSTAAAGTGGVLTNTGNTNMPNAVTGTAGLAFVRAGTGFGDALQVNGSTYGYTGGLTITSTTAGAVSAANLAAAGGVTGTTNLTIRFNLLAAVGAGTITLNNGGIHDTATGTYANNLVVGANGGFFHVDGAAGATLSGSLTGSGFLLLQNGFNGSDSFTGSNTAFTGTLGIDTNNISGLNLSGSATGNSAMSLVFGGNTTTQGNVQWNGTGSPTITLGEVSTASGSTTTAGLRGSTTAATTVTYQIGDNTANTPVFIGIIANGTGNATTSVTAVTKVGTDNQTFSGVNTYTGATLVSGGTLTLGVANTLAKTSGITVNSGTLTLAATSALATPVATTGTLGTTVAVTGQVPVTLGGGMLARSGAGVSLGSQSGTAGTVGIGMLTLTAASTLDFGAAGVGTLNFSGFADSGNFLLTVLNYTHTTAGTGVDGTDDRLIFNQNMSAFLTDFSINGQTPTQVALGNGEFEVVGAAVPEPSTLVGGLLGVGVLGFRLRRRVAWLVKRLRLA